MHRKTGGYKSPQSGRASLSQHGYGFRSGRGDPNFWTGPLADSSQSFLFRKHRSQVQAEVVSGPEACEHIETSPRRPRQHTTTANANRSPILISVPCREGSRCSGHHLGSRSSRELALKPCRPTPSTAWYLKCCSVMFLNRADCLPVFGPLLQRLSQIRQVQKLQVACKKLHRKRPRRSFGFYV